MWMDPAEWSRSWKRLSFSPRGPRCPLTHTHTTDQSLYLLFTVVATATRTDEVPLWLYTTQLITHNCASFPYWFAADFNAPHDNYSLVVKIFKIFAMGRIISMHLHWSRREVYFFEDIALFTHGMCPGLSAYIPRPWTQHERRRSTVSLSIRAERAGKNIDRAN